MEPPNPSATSAAAGATATHASPGGEGKWLKGRRLLLARVVWLTLLLSTIALFVAAIPARRAELLLVFRNLSPAQELVLQDLGVSGDQHARLVLAVEVGVAAVFFSVALLILWRRSNDGTAMFVSLTMATFAAWNCPPLDALAAAQPIWQLPSNLIQATGMISSMIFLYVFPDGRVVPRWTRPLLLLMLGWGLGWVIFPSSPLNHSDPYRAPLMTFTLVMLSWTAGMGAQAYRFVRVATPIQRQQTKLVVFGATIGILGYLVFGFDRFAVPILDQPRHASVVYDLIGLPIYLLMLAIIPVAFAISVLRYRLWDIDIVINRTLVYGILTAVLAGLYTASIAFSQRAFVALTGEKSDAAIVLTTLVVASAFTPVKGRLQIVVDRYVRPMPDPVREVRALGERVRSLVEVIDVEQLTRRVCDEAVRAFDATGGAVYLRGQEGFTQIHVCGDWRQVEGMTAWLQIDGARYGWIALGPRRNGLDYRMEDRMVFTDVAAVATRMIQLLGIPTVARTITRRRDGQDVQDR